MELVQIYFKKLNKVAVISNFLAFFQFLVDKFTLLDPDLDPGGKMNADPCKLGSGSSALFPSDMTYSCFTNKIGL